MVLDPSEENNMAYGYHGRILHVDLTSGKLEVENPGDEFYRRYVGGSAVGLYYLLRHTPAKTDAFGPENTLVLTVGPLTGAPISGQSRVTATAKSPLTNAVGDSQGGGFFPAEMKFAGFDAIVIRGRSKRPVYLWIHEGTAELRPADHLWGKFTGEAEALIRKELGDDKIEVLQIGPAGEKRVRIAALISMRSRANGRTGMGAVMGSKNLKAVAVRGTKKPKLVDRKQLMELAQWGADSIEGSAVFGLGMLGTAEILEGQNAAGGLPTRNWTSGAFDGWQAIDGKTMAKTVLKGRDTCYACAIRCKRVVEITEGEYKVDPRYGGPEYETLSSLGSYCGVSDLAAVSYANQLCNMYGLDTISCGATIAWAMECYERGIITKEDTGGIDLRFGNASALVKITELIGKREGFGDLLAEGSVRAAKRIGRGAEALVVAVKGQEFPAHMPQVKRSLALIYAVNPFGADHQSHEHDPGYRDFPARMAEIGLTHPQPDDVLNEEKVWFSWVTQKAYSFLDSGNLCQFVFGPAFHLYGMAQLAQAVKAVTGWEVTVEDLLRVGERRLNMLRAFNAREGIGREADVLPSKIRAPLVGGKSDGVFVTDEEVERAKDLYYAMAGWDVATGKPTRRKLEELELGWVADDLGL
jgi:aldehyde:ferredoxin oxidoreductase